MNLLPSAQRERHAFVDRTVDRTMRIVMGDAAVRAVLGRGVYRELIALTDNYAVPNKRDNTFYPTKSQLARGAYFLIAAGKSEKMRLSPDFAVFSERQRQSIRKNSRDYLDLEDMAVEDWIEEQQTDTRDTYLGDRTVTTMGEEYANAAVLNFVAYASDPADDDGFYITKTQPVMVMRTDAPLHPLAFLHEMVHIWQEQTQPIQFVEPGPFGDERLLLRSERQAYSIQNKLADTGEFPRASKGFRDSFALHRYEPRAITRALRIAKNRECSPADLLEYIQYERLQHLRSVGDV